MCMTFRLLLYESTSSLETLLLIMLLPKRVPDFSTGNSTGEAQTSTWPHALAKTITLKISRILRFPYC
jgi:hypothetical protein